MTMFDNAVRLVHERIANAPVEQWLRDEAYADLRRLREAAQLDLSERELATEPEPQPDTEPVNVEASVNETPTSWQRMQIVDAILRDRTPISTEEIVSRARAIESYVKNG